MKLDVGKTGKDKKQINKAFTALSGSRRFKHFIL